MSRIRVLTGLSPASEFMVLAHEFAHLCTGIAYVTDEAGTAIGAAALEARTAHKQDARVPEAASDPGTRTVRAASETA